METIKGDARIKLKATLIMDGGARRTKRIAKTHTLNEPLHRYNKLPYKHKKLLYRH